MARYERRGVAVVSGSPFVDFDRSSWSQLRDTSAVPLTAHELEELRSLGDPVDLDEVRDVYLPVSRLLDLHIRATSGLLEAYRTFLRQDEQATPFVVGIAGSVSVGKSTTARLLRLLLARWADHPDVALVTTDGFLYPNAELERRGIMRRKGFPESYDRRALLRFVSDIKAGKPEVPVPTYSHLTYDVLEEQRVVSRPDILVLEGLNVLQPAPQTGERASALAVSDLIDFSIYVDAHPTDVRRWYVERFLALRETAFRDPASYFRRYAEMEEATARAQAGVLWDEINGPNLRENIAPTRSRADLVLTKGGDHSVRRIRLRKL
jgi:type I pantothenate kinase